MDEAEPHSQEGTVTGKSGFLQPRDNRDFLPPSLRTSSSRSDSVDVSKISNTECTIKERTIAIERNQRRAHGFQRLAREKAGKRRDQKGYGRIRKIQ